MYSKVIQLHIYFFQILFPYRLLQTIGIVSCAVQWVPAGYLLCVCHCVYVNPKLLIYAPPHPFSEKEMATHSSTLAWKIPWTEEPGGLQSTGLLRVRYDWATSLSLFTFIHWRLKWQPTPMLLPWESQGWVMGSHRVGHDWSNLAAAAAAATLSPLLTIRLFICLRIYFCFVYKFICIFF